VLWGWGGYWKVEKIWVTRYWSNSSRIWFKQRECQCVVKCMNLLILLGTRKNCLRSKLVAHKKSDTPECTYFDTMSLLSTANKTWPNFTCHGELPYVNEVIGDQHCRFLWNRSTTDYVFWICHIYDKKWQYCVAVPQLFIEFNKAYDWITMEIICNIQ